MSCIKLYSTFKAFLLQVSLALLIGSQLSNGNCRAFYNDKAYPALGPWWYNRPALVWALDADTVLLPSLHTLGRTLSSHFVLIGSQLSNGNCRAFHNNKAYPALGPWRHNRPALYRVFVSLIVSICDQSPFNSSSVIRYKTLWTVMLL
jgi:hypothetical protein